MPVIHDPRELNQLSRDILRENENVERQARFDAAADSLRASANTWPMLSLTALVDAIAQIREGRKLSQSGRTYLLPREMPLYERDGLYVRLDRLSKLRPR